LRWDAVQAQLDQHSQPDSVDAKRGEIDTLETREVTQHVAPDASPPRQLETRKPAAKFRTNPSKTDCTTNIPK
jgi:hypothetical protein